ncbi:MAG TPA: alpha/beta hydrolase [Methylophilaceae bacterium]|nr:alpha/beta hydrolase [Methylophilaceae bacterium]
MTLTRKLSLLCCAAAGLIVAACSPVTLLNLAVPDDGYRKTSDIAYGPTERNKLDVYVPKAPLAKPLPVVVFFYGGTWEAGRRQDYQFVAQALTASGFVAVVPDYRVYPEVVFPAFMQDAAAAVKWTRDNIARFGGDPTQLFVMGHSAGAHIAALLTLDGEYLRDVGLQPQDLDGMIGLAGPYDFLPLQNDRLKIIFGPEDERWKSQPVNFVDGHNPPMLLVVGTADKRVLPKNTYSLASRLKAAGGPVEIAEFRGWGHIDIVAKLAKPLRDETLLQTIVRFIRAHANTDATPAAAQDAPAD